MLKIKDNYKQKVTTISGYSSRNYEENLERFRKKLNKKDGYIEAILTISSIIIYQEKTKADLVEKVDD